MVMIEVYQVSRCTALGILIGLAVNDPAGIDAIAAGRGPLRMIKIILVHSKDEAAEPRHRLEIISRCQSPGLAVMTSRVEAALPRPASTRKAVDTLEHRDATSKRHQRARLGMAAHCDRNWKLYGDIGLSGNRRECD